MKSLRVAVVINFVTDYRYSFYVKLFKAVNWDVHVYCQEPPKGSALRAVHHLFPDKVVLSKARYFAGEVLVWTSLPWRRLLTEYDVVVVEGNPRYLALALLSTFLVVARKTVVLWTMVHSHRNRRWAKRVRLAWTGFFKNLIVYSDQEVQYLRSLGFSKQKITGINNGLDQERISTASRKWKGEALLEWKRENRVSGRRILLSCARLVEKNDFPQMMEALKAIRREVNDVLWVIIGDGSERAHLEGLATKLGLLDSVRFVGAIHDEEGLAPWFVSAELLIHPGAIGLTLLHAFGYGVPVVTHSDVARHGPEVCAFVEGGERLVVQAG